MVTSINEDLRQLEGLDVPRVNAILVKHSCYHFPTKHSSNAPPHHNSQVQEVVQRRWRHLREATRPRVATFGGVFQAWRTFADFGHSESSQTEPHALPGNKNMMSCWPRLNAMLSSTTCINSTKSYVC